MCSGRAGAVPGRNRVQVSMGSKRRWFEVSMGSGRFRGPKVPVFDGRGLAKVPGSGDCIRQVWKVAVVLKVLVFPGFDRFRGSENGCGFEGFGVPGFDGF